MIERRTINGRPCTIAYFDRYFRPVDKTTPGHFAKILYDDGDMIILKAPDDLSDLEPTEDEQRADHIKTFQHAIKLLNDSEGAVRDTIERGMPRGRVNTWQAHKRINRVVERVKSIRRGAIKAAFRHIRSKTNG